MGIFDRFKKKSNKSPQERQSKLTNEKADREKENAKKDLLNKLEQSEESLRAELAAEPNDSDTEAKIIMTEHDQGGHGDNFGGLVGFNYLNTEKGNQFLNEMIAAAAVVSPSNTIGNGLATSVVNFLNAGGNSEQINLKTIAKNDELISAFPYLKTKYNLPFETKEIVEWSHVSNLEAEIKGGGRDTFGLGFFATDYAENKATYQSNKKINIHISAIALVLDKSELTEINGTPVSPDFATYMPNSNLSRPTYYDFIGVLNDFKPSDLSKESTGYILNVKLINQEDDPNFFTVDVFVNRENMRINKLTKGMKVAGALWFQGEIV